MNQQEYLQHIIEKYLEGKATSAETAWLNEWFASLNVTGQELPSTGNKEWLREKIFARTQENIREQEGALIGSEDSEARIIPMQPNRRKVFRMALSVASVTIIALITTLSIVRKQKSGPQLAFRDVHTTNGQLLKVVLSDSSVVWLNANSHLHYPEQFHPDKRLVSVQGEAYFEVQHDQQRPFIIESNGFRTRVLGTTFGIRSYDESRFYQVTVTSGKVAVYNPADSLSLRPIYLTPDQQVQIDRQTGQPLVRTVNATSLMAWKQGGMSFDREWLEEALRTIGNKYNVQFRITNEPVKQLTITADFDQNESLNNIISILNRVYKLQFVKEKNGLIEVR